MTSHAGGWVGMERIANLKDIKRGRSLYFNYKGKRAILVRTKGNELVAYVASCPHMAGNILWDDRINKLVCETHMSLFNVKDGTIYRHSSLFKLDKGLTKIELKVDSNGDIFAI